MFRISLDLLIIIGSNRYSLPITLFTKSYSNACLQLLSQLFAWLLDSMLYQYAPVQALLWTGGAIWLHALAINPYLTRYLHLSFIYTIEESSRNTLILKIVIMTRRLYSQVYQWLNGYLMVYTKARFCYLLSP